MAAMPPANFPYPPPADRAKKIIAVDIVFIVLVTIAVGLRVGGRRLKGTPILLEDWMVLAGLVSSHAKIDRLVKHR